MLQVYAVNPNRQSIPEKTIAPLSDLIRDLKLADLDANRNLGL
jgi:hypothetical protein